MQDIRSQLAALNRPALLVRAARIGAARYARDTSLARLLGTGPLPAPRVALARLLEMEAELDRARRARRAEYRAAGHVEVLIAVMGEARDLDAVSEAAPRAPQPKASDISPLRVATKAPSASSMAGSSTGCW